MLTKEAVRIKHGGGVGGAISVQSEGADSG